MTEDQSISPDFPYESKFSEVRGSKMHYVEQGSGDPLLFIHGNPTSSYLWRNVIPHVAPYGRAIAVDLIGMGKSDKPNIPYRFFDHSSHLEGFIEALGLRNVTLILHDWGGALGIYYARRHQDNVRGVAFMEAVLRTTRWEEFPPKFKITFKLFRAPVIGWLLISVGNVFIQKILPQTIVRPLSAEEMEHYASPYPTVASRRPLRQWPREIPIDGQPADVHEAVAANGYWLAETELPKLFLKARPGAIVSKKLASWVQESCSNLETVQIGKGLHFIQEDRPHEIGAALATWLAKVR